MYYVMHTFTPFYRKPTDSLITISLLCANACNGTIVWRLLKHSMNVRNVPKNKRAHSLAKSITNRTQNTERWEVVTATATITLITHHIHLSDWD